MPAFDLRGIKVAAYTNTNGTVTYGTPTSAGDAMTAQLELRFAEGRLYAESKLAEYLRLATGGTISLGTKYIPDAAKKILYGATDSSRTVDGSSVAGIKYTALDVAGYVGCGFFAPDMVDGVEKYTCVFIPKAKFGPPAMNFNTKGENITFQTPTTTGEFLPDDTTGQLLIETTVVDTAAEAAAWVAACFA